MLSEACLQIKKSSCFENILNQNYVLSSREWEYVSDAKKQQLGFDKNAEGEFWYWNRLFKLI